MVNDTHCNWYAHTCIIKSHGFHTSPDSEITGVSTYSSLVQQSCDPIHVHVHVCNLDQSRCMLSYLGYGCAMPMQSTIATVRHDFKHMGLRSTYPHEL